MSKRKQYALIVTLRDGYQLKMSPDDFITLDTKDAIYISELYTDNPSCQYRVNANSRWEDFPRIGQQHASDIRQHAE